MNHQEDKDLGLKLMAWSLMRAVQKAQGLADQFGPGFLRSNLVVKSAQGGSIEVGLPATNMLDFLVQRIRLLVIESNDEHNEKLVIVLNGAVPEPFRRACLILSSEADVKAFLALMKQAGKEDFRPGGYLQGRVAPKACLFDTPEPQGEPGQLMYTDTGNFLSPES